jgi:hypothetical protein
MPGSAAAETVAQPCAALAQVVADVPGLVPMETDPRATDEQPQPTAPGCQIRLTGHVSAFRGAASPDERLRRALANWGWREDLRSAADGPDGTAFAFEKGAILCLVRAGWDGGDDGDPSYVLADSYDLTIGCTAGSR